jgi:hypothetical protein
MVTLGVFFFFNGNFWWRKKINGENDFLKFSPKYFLEIAKLNTKNKPKGDPKNTRILIPVTINRN